MPSSPVPSSTGAGSFADNFNTTGSGWGPDWDFSSTSPTVNRENHDGGNRAHLQHTSNGSTLQATVNGSAHAGWNQFDASAKFWLEDSGQRVGLMSHARDTNNNGTYDDFYLARYKDGSTAYLEIFKVQGGSMTRIANKSLGANRFHLDPNSEFNLQLSTRTSGSGLQITATLSHGSSSWTTSSTQNSALTANNARVGVWANGGNTRNVWIDNFSTIEV